MQTFHKLVSKHLLFGKEAKFLQSIQGRAINPTWVHQLACHQLKHKPRNKKKKKSKFSSQSLYICYFLAAELNSMLSSNLLSV